MNTKPSTPFGKFFDSIGIWEPTAEKIVKKAYGKLSKDVQLAINLSSGYVAIINENIDKVPDEIFELIAKKYPDATKEGVHKFITGILDKLQIASGFVPATYEEAMIYLQGYLKKFEGAAWVTTVRSLVSIGSTVFNPEITMIQKVLFVLEYVYRDIVQPYLKKK